MNRAAKKLSPIGLVCVACYLALQVVLVFFFPSDWGDTFWALVVTFPWVRLTTAFFANTAAQLSAGILLASLTYYSLGHILDRVYFGKSARKLPCE